MESGEQWPSEDALRRRVLKLITLPAFHGRNLRKLVEKKRLYSSSSEESSPPPLVAHDYKKPRGESFTFIDVTNHEGVTELSPALEMTEKLEEKLQAILTKLEKLDAIEKSVKILQETFAGMDSRIQSLESAQESAYRDINVKLRRRPMQENHRELHRA